MRPAPYRPAQSTVLVPSSSSQPTISSDHPMFYVRQKNYFLQQLSSKVTVQTKFNPIDLKRNVRVDHFMERHARISKDIEKEERKRQMFLSSDQFTPIVGLGEEEKRRKREVKQAERLRQELYQNYIEECEIHEAPQQDTPLHSHTQPYQQFQLVRNQQHLKNFTVLSDYRSDPNRRKQLYLIDMQIAKLKEQETLQKLVKKKQSECQNNDFLSKVSNTILSSYMVYFEEIFAELIDQILQEEVVYFNGLEAGFYEGGERGREGGQEVGKEMRNRNQGNEGSYRNQKKAKNYHKEAKQLEADVRAIKMMELVKALDQLAYD